MHVALTPQVFIPILKLRLRAFQWVLHLGYPSNGYQDMLNPNAQLGLAKPSPNGTFQTELWPL